MRPISWILVALLLLLQYPLWFGKGGWLRVSELKHEMQAQEKFNASLVQRNARLEAEVNDLIYGQAAIEERARFELGMIKKDEVFFQVMEPAPKDLTSGTPR